MSAQRRMKRPFVPSWLGQAEIGPAPGRVLMYLWSLAEPDGNTCAPGVADVMRACLIREPRTAYRALRMLEAAGFLRVERQRGRVNLYSLVVPAAPGENDSGCTSRHIDASGCESRSRISRAKPSNP